MLDDLDRALIHALHLDGRAPFSRIADVLGVSAQTVARRYRRLRTEASLRVVGLTDPHQAGHTQWLVRLTVSARSAREIAQALVRRRDTSWVKLASGGTEIVAVVHAPTDGEGANSLLLHDIPRTVGIISMSAHCLLHTYLGGPANWRRSADALDAEQQRVLREGRQAAGGTVVRRPGEADAELLAALQRDGRAALGDLARAAGWSPATVTRRLAELRCGGGLFFDVDVGASGAPGGGGDGPGRASSRPAGSWPPPATGPRVRPSGGCGGGRGGGGLRQLFRVLRHVRESWGQRGSAQRGLSSHGSGNKDFLLPGGRG